MAKEKTLEGKKIISVIAIFLFLFVVNVAVHELTHVALNDFRFMGFCVLDCGPMLKAGMFGNGYTPVGVYLLEPINPLAENETLAHTIGLSTSLILGLLFYVKMVQKD